MTVQVLGLATSAASIIAMAGDRIEIARSAQIMIHRAHAGAIGNAAIMRIMAEALERTDAAMAGVYHARTSLSLARVVALMEVAGDRLVGHYIRQGTGLREARMLADREDRAAVVVVGGLNPLIFQPEWLRSNQIIGQDEAEQASGEGGIEIISRELTSINLKAKKLIVDTQRFVIWAMEHPLVAANDFATSCFGLLSHTPVSALGINRELVFRCPSVDAWHNIGEALAPRRPWSALVPPDDAKERRGGLRTITYENSFRPDGAPGYVRATVSVPENSNLCDVKVSINDHFTIGEPNKMGSGEDVVEILAARWTEAMDRSLTIIDSIKSLTNVR